MNWIMLELTIVMAIAAVGAWVFDLYLWRRQRRDEERIVACERTEILRNVGELNAEIRSELESRRHG